MRRAVLTDIHGNLHALKATLASIDKANTKQIVCLGDTVGYGANPTECISLVRQRCDIVLAGNHDWGVSGKISLHGFNRDAQEAAEWSRRQLSGEEIDWLSSLPLSWKSKDLHFHHASPEAPAFWLYLRDEASAKRALEETGASILFVGHSHRATVYEFEGGRVVIAGSVGQPRDGDHRACWCLFDDESGELEFVRVEYNVAAAQLAIRNAGLPERLATRLNLGV